MNLQASKLERSPLALWFSRLFHPFVLPIPTLILGTYLAGNRLNTAVLWTGLFLLCVIVPTALYIAWGIRSGYFKDRDVSDQRERRRLYLLGGSLALLFLISAYLAEAPRYFVGSLAAAILAVTIAAIFNRFVTKVSIHSTVACGSALILGFVWLAGGIAVGLIVLLVSWSRLELQHHSFKQVVLGWLIAAVSVWIVFTLYL